MTSTNDVSSSLVVIDYNDILTDPHKHDKQSLSRILSLIEKSYGSNESSLGILAIRNIPGFVKAKQRFLPQAHTLTHHLPESYLENYLTDSKSLYNAGWSHGKEKIGDKPDRAKGSFYFNPVSDCPGSPEDRAKYPVSYPCNVWPEESKMPNFQKEAKELGTLMKDVSVLLSRYIDVYAKEKLPLYKENLLYDLLKDSEKVKARLLYYFPISSDGSSETNKEEEQEEEEEKKSGSSNPNKNGIDSWIGWHNDSGFLTALAGDIYVNDESGEILEKSLDPKSGLYVMNRSGEQIHVKIPPDCMAIQLGECVQIITGGGLVATPHCVRGADQRCCSSISVARISEACFIDTVPTYPLLLPKGVTRESVLESGVKSERIPPLGSRWLKDGMNFGDFLQQTFEMYYTWSK